MQVLDLTLSLPQPLAAYCRILFKYLDLFVNRILDLIDGFFADAMNPRFELCDTPRQTLRDLARIEDSPLMGI